MDGFQGELLTDTPICGLRRSADAVHVILSDGREYRHDHVVVATHADEAYRLLTDPSEDEKRLLKPWRYNTNQVVLHTDPGFMPPNRKAWASWNYHREAAASTRSPVTLTYHMNRLQRLDTQAAYFVTLNPIRTIDDKYVVERLTYTHPMFTFESLATQPRLERLNQGNRTSYCGSYFGYGFHEDAVRAATRVAASFGITL
jgi:predicted NAD/FAD-binding protein